MPSVTITLSDTPDGGVSIYTDFKPAVGNPCSAAQSAALDIISRTRKVYGLSAPDAVAFRVGGVDIDAVHHTRTSDGTQA